MDNKEQNRKIEPFSLLKELLLGGVFSVAVNGYDVQHKRKTQIFPSLLIFQVKIWAICLNGHVCLITGFLLERVTPLAADNSVN